MYALKIKQGNVIGNKDIIVIVHEEYHRDLYSIREIQDNTERGSNYEEIGIPPVTTEEIKTALEEIQRVMQRLSIRKEQTS